MSLEVLCHNWATREQTLTTKYTFTYTTVAQDAEHRDILKHDTCGEASLFMTLGEFDIEVGD